jgi:hypothetical protein
MTDQQDATSADDVESPATGDDDAHAEQLLADAVSDGQADDSDEPDADAGGKQDDDKPLGPAGEKALAAEKDKRRAESARRRDAEKRAADAEAELAKLRRAAERAKALQGQGDAKDEGPPPEPPADIDPDEIRLEAEKAATTKANERIIKAEIRASAVGKLADPKDALIFLDLSAFEVDADGNVDTEQIDDAIAVLLKNKPYLAVPAQGEAKRFKGSGDGGAKPNKPARPKSLGEAVSRALTKP